jgi:hypothetical protein
VAEWIQVSLEVLADVQCGMTIDDAVALARSRHTLSEDSWSEISRGIEHSHAEDCEVAP